jgi:hypothetical protein
MRAGGARRWLALGERTQKQENRLRECRGIVSRGGVRQERGQVERIDKRRNDLTPTPFRSEKTLGLGWKV